MGPGPWGRGFLKVLSAVGPRFQGTQAIADAGRAGVQEELGFRRRQVT